MSPARRAVERNEALAILKGIIFLCAFWLAVGFAVGALLVGARCL